MIPLQEQLKKSKVIIADGAVGTMLFQLGLKPGDCPERINLEKPEMIEYVAQQYLDAGAEIIQTNTFGGSPLKLAKYLLDNKTEEINAGAIRVIRKVAAGKAYIAASCGPTGELLEPFGDTSEEKVFETYQRQMKIFVEEGVDIICIETMTDLKEATLAIKAARSLSSSILISATMTFDETPRGFYTIMGVSIEQAAESLAQAGANIIGSNCGNGILNMIKIAGEFKKVTLLPIIIRSNAGLPILKDGFNIYPETAAFMADKSRELVKLGVNIIGGCCGTTPDHIATIKKIIIENSIGFNKTLS